MIEENRKWLILDTDAGVDDAVAISLALQLGHKYNYEVKYLTTVFGNCSLEKVIKNVAKTRAANGLDASKGPQMIRGSIRPLQCEHNDASYFHGLDGMGNNSFPDELDESSGSAATFPDTLNDICMSAKANYIDITLLMLGPLTNLAITVQKYPSILKNLHQLVLMAGSGNGRGNVTRTAEFNVYADPEAAAIVFQAISDTQTRCILVSYDLTLQYPIPWSTFDEFIATNHHPNSNRLRYFLCSILDHTYNKNRAHNAAVHESDFPEGANICDALAVAVALCPEAMILQETGVNVDVELTGTMTRGQTVVDWGCYDGVVRYKNCRWVTHIDNALWLGMIKELFGL